jgi:hypothetical protein
MLSTSTEISVLVPKKQKPAGLDPGRLLKLPQS